VHDCYLGQTCCKGQQAMHIHGGGPATSGQSSQNGWIRASMVRFSGCIWMIQPQ